MSPSPTFFTSVPPAAAMAVRNREKCTCRSDSAPSGPSCEASSVDPTRSVKTTVVVTVAVMGTASRSAAISRGHGA